MLFILLRLIVFTSTNIPYGYDSGMYKSLFQENSNSILNGKLEQENWAENKHFIGISFIMYLFLISGISLKFIILYLPILFEVLTIFSLYIFTKKYFNKKTAEITILIYISSINSVYPLLFSHYKTIIGINLILLIFYFLKNGNLILFIISSCFLSSFHKLSFFLFGIIYLIYWIFNKREKKYFFSGVIIILFFILINFELISNYIDLLLNVLSSNSFNSNSGGNYISIYLFFKNFIIYIPFLFIGVYNYYLKDKRVFEIPSYLFIILILFIIFKFFFYLRWLAYLNIILIIFTSYGFIKSFEKYKKITRIIFIIILAISFINLFLISNTLYTKINNNELKNIEWININTPNNSKIFMTSKYYLPWLLGWSGRDIVSVGDFNLGYENILDDDWKSYLNGNLTILEDYLDNQSYIYIGKIGKINIYNYKNNKCYDIVYKDNNSIIIHFIC